MRHKEQTKKQKRMNESKKKKKKRENTKLRTRWVIILFRLLYFL